MTDLWGNWYYNHMRGGTGFSRSACVNGEVSAFAYGINNAAYVAFMPMMTELRENIYEGERFNIYDLGTFFGYETEIDYDTRRYWQYVSNWEGQCQEAQYAYDCLSAAVDPYQDALRQNIEIWKGIAPSADTNCPMNEQWLPQATHLSSLFTDLSSLEGTNQRPWWWRAPTYDSGLIDWRRFTTYIGPYLPSNINWKWYKAMWRAVSKLANTPSIKIGKGDTDWRWLNPLRQSSGSAYFDIGRFLTQTRFSWWSEIDSTFVPEFDDAICGGSPELYNMPWSVCGCPIGKALYTGDASGQMSSEYKNLPILEPLDGMRAFFGEPISFANTYSGRGDIRYKYGDTIFDEYSVPQSLTEILSIGCDFDFPNSYAFPYSFIQKAGRTSTGELQSVKLSSDADYLCKPPFRLCAQNFLAHQWLWESFLDGKHSNGDSHSNLIYAWTPFIFNRMHFYRHYTFNVGGEAHLSTDGESWKMVVNQSETTNSWSNYDWRPVSELLPHEPVVANIGPNTFKWWNNSSYGSNMPSGRWPQGYTGISCVFEIPLPLSVDSNGVAVFDTEWLSTSGYTRQEWNEFVRITQSMFPRTRDTKIEELLAELSAQYLDPNTGLIPYSESQLTALQESIDYCEEKLDAVSADTWYTVWWTVVNQVWDETSVDFDFNEGITATSAWDGTDPAPFDNYLSDWNGTYWFNNGYSNSIPLSAVNGTFDDGYPGYGPWKDDLASAFNTLSAEIGASKVYKDGQLVGPLYSDYQMNLMWGALSSTWDSLSANGSSALAGAGIDLEAIGTQWPPATCTITTDPQTGTETSSYTQDENAWKRAVMRINNILRDYASTWFVNTNDCLENAFQAYPYNGELSDKWDYIYDVSAVLDSTMRSAWEAEYGIALPLETQWWLDQIADLEQQIQDLSDYIDELSAEYDEEYQRIMDETEDDPLPSKTDLEKFLHYQLDPHAQSLSTNWSASLNLLAIAPDTWEEQLSDYRYDYIKYDEQTYYCEAPKTRWPAEIWPTWYMVPMKKTSLEQVTVNGNTQLSNIVRGRVYGDIYNGYYMKPFDDFRYDIDTYAERDEANFYFGVERPNPTQLFGSEVNNPGRWNLSAVVSVDIGDMSQGIFDIQDARDLAYYNTLSVRFQNKWGGGETYEAYALYIWCTNGPEVHTIDCRQGVSRWSRNGTVGWKLADGESEKVEYYAKEPEAGVDYDLPELSGQLTIEVGRQVLGALDMPTVYSLM